MEQINFFHKGISSGIDYSKVSSDSWVFPSMNVEILNKENQGLIATRIKGVEAIITLPNSFMAIGACEIKGMVFIVSYNAHSDETEIGVYPSPKSYSVSGDYVYNTGIEGYENVYKALPNLHSGLSDRSIFRTNLLHYSVNNPVSILPYVSYDNSIDMIIIDGVNTNKIINSGFELSGRLNSRIIELQDFENVLDQIKTTDKYPRLGTFDVQEDSLSFAASSKEDYNSSQTVLQNVNNALVTFGINDPIRLKMDNEYVASNNYVIEDNYGFYLIDSVGKYNFLGTIYVALSSTTQDDINNSYTGFATSVKLKLICLRNNVQHVVSESVVTYDSPYGYEVKKAIPISYNPDYIFEVNDKVYLIVEPVPFEFDNTTDYPIIFKFQFDSDSSYWKYESQQSENNPILIREGGNLLPGNYFIAIRYSTFDFNRTRFSLPIGPVPIFLNNLAGDQEGAKYDIPTNREMVLTLDNIDRSYEYYEVAIIRYFGQLGITSNEVYLISNRYSTNQNKLLINGKENRDVITIEEILNTRGVEKTCEVHTFLNNRYWGASWKGMEIDKKALADLSLKITADYICEKSLIDTSLDELEGTYPNNSNNSMFYGYKSINNSIYYVGYPRGGVFPFAVRFIMSDDSITPAFAIKGCDYYSGNAGKTNDKGIIRFPFYNKQYDGDQANINDDNYVLGIKFNMNEFFNTIRSSSFSNKIKSYFFVRSEEIENTLYQGIACHMVKGFFNRFYVEIDEKYFPIMNDEVPTMLVPYNNSTWADSSYLSDVVGINGRFDVNANLLAFYCPDILFEMAEKTFAGRSYYIQVIAHHLRENSSVNQKRHPLLRPELYANDYRNFVVDAQGVYKCKIVKVPSETNIKDGSKIYMSYAKVGEFCKYIDPEVHGLNHHVYNRTMQTVPYLAIDLDESISTGNHARMTYKINVYKNDPTNENYLDGVVENYNPYNNTYSKITDEKSLNETIVVKAYCGNTYSTRMFFRQMHWRELEGDAQVGGDTMPGTDEWDYYMHGYLIGIKLESKINLAFRHSDSNFTYYPKVRLDEVKPFLQMNDPAILPIKSNAFEFVLNMTNYYAREAFYMNTGYQKSICDSIQSGYDNAVPNENIVFGTRIRASAISRTSSFINGYNIFDPSNYKDYDFVAGKITGLFDLNGILISVQEKRINQHFLDEKYLNADQLTGVLTIGSGSVLSQETKELASFGSQHKHGIKKYNDSIYGVDMLRNIIWASKTQVSTFGKYVPGIVNFTENKLLQHEFKSLLTSIGVDPDNVKLGDNPFYSGVTIGYDPFNKHIIFGFINNGENAGLLFSEEIGEFTGKCSLISPLYQSVDDKLFSFYTIGNVTKMYRHGIGFKDYTGDVLLFIISIVCNGLREDENTSIFEKEFLENVIECPPIIFDYVEYLTQNQYALRLPFTTNGVEFWKDPRYNSSVWCVPIIKSQSAIHQYYADSIMIGQWLRLTLGYSREEKIFIKNIKTSFNLKP